MENPKPEPPLYLSFAALAHKATAARPATPPVPQNDEVIATTKWHRVAPETLDEPAAKPALAVVRAPARGTEPAPSPSSTQTPTPPGDGKQPWAELEKIGLKPKPAPSTRAAKLIVSTYRLLGFGILTAIVVALVGYIAITLFYFASDSWLTPTVISATDDKVVALQGELAAQQNERDRIADALTDAERTMANELAFQAKFVAAIEADLQSRKTALRRVQELAGVAAKTRQQIREVADEFASSAATRMDAHYSAGMIDRHTMLDGKHQLAQITSSKLSLAERQAAFETQAADLARHTEALDALLADRDVPLSYDVLEIKRDYDASKLAVAKAVETRKTLVDQLTRQDLMIASLRASPHLRALADRATVALVPYANLDNAKPGTPLYACRLEMFWCREVGTVLEILPGEIQFRHPHRDTVVRGQMIEMRLTDAAAARDDVLFAGGKPLGL